MPKKESYTLLNPKIKGSFKTKTREESPIDAAHSFYEKISQVNGNAVKHMFMIIGGKDDHMHHFYVTEKITGGSSGSDRKSKYTIYEIDPSFTGAYQRQLEDVLIGEQKKDSQRGGKKHKSKRRRHDDSDSDSDSDSDIDFSDSDSDSDSYIDRQRYIPYISDYIYYAVRYPTIKAIGLTHRDMRKFFLPSFVINEPVGMLEIPFVEVNWELIYP
jgi:hypothetical protein